MKKIILLTSLLCCSKFCFPQAGELDPSFGNNGIVTTDMGAPFNYTPSVKQVLTQADGSLYVIVQTPNPLAARSWATGQTVIIKKHPDGSADLTYGKNGYSIAVPVYQSHAAMQSDGKIVVAGYSVNSDFDSHDQSKFITARFNTDGSLDNTFGTNGVELGVGGSNKYAQAVAFQSDGKIVVGGIAGDQSVEYFEVVRYNADGTPDEGFAAAQFPMDLVVNNNISSIAIKSDGKIVVGGSAITVYNGDGSVDGGFNGGSRLFISGNVDAIVTQDDGKILVLAGNSIVARYKTDGTLDNTYGVNGIQTTDFAATAMALESDGKIMLAGYSGPGNTSFAIGRYNTDGTPDNTFAGDGIQVTDIASGTAYVNSLVIQSDGKFLALGYTVSGANIYVAATQYDATGNLDNSFHDDGILTALVGPVNQGSTFYTSTAIQSDGKALAAGYTWNGSNYDFAIVRYNTDGSLDNTFSGDGKQTTDFGSTNDTATAIIIQSDGKILVAGAAGNKVGLARYNTDGTPDMSFAGDGIQITDFGSSYNTASLALQSDGKIIVGTSSLARYNADGSPDAGFDGDGKAPLFVNTYNVVATAAVIQGNKIVILGKDMYGRYFVARYNTDGSQDNTFQNGTPFFFDGSGLQTLIGTSIGIQSDGRILLGGNYLYNYMTTTSQFALMRLKADGTIDSTLNGVGYVVPAINQIARSTSIITQNDDKIILGGYADNSTNGNYGSNDDFAIMRFNTDGSVDNTFSGDGRVVTPVSASFNRVAAMAIFNGKLYAAGFGQYPGNFGVVARYALSEGGPLPVSLLNFTGINQTSTVLLKWELATQKNITSFVIERSGDGNSFFPINRISVAGVNSSTANYSIIDNHPIAGINFYRLKMIDADGKFTYSNIVAVKLNTGLKLRVFPNPAQKILFVEATGNDENAIVRIVDESGRTLKEIKIFLAGTTSFSVDISNLASGVYNLLLRKKEHTVTQKFIKK